MEDIELRPPKNSVSYFKLEIKQKSAHIKKRKVKTWSPDEDEHLIKLYEDYPKKWGVIASMMPERNENQCLHRFRRLSQLGAHKKIWSLEEDQAILVLIKKFGKNWKKLAQIIGTKTGKQIRQRFINKLDPQIKNEDWTDEEDKLILKYYSEVGSKWSQISKRLPGRPENKIKNRFYSYIQKNYEISYVNVDPLPEEPNEKPHETSKQDLNLLDYDSLYTVKQEQNQRFARFQFAELKNLQLNQVNKKRKRLGTVCSRFSKNQNQQNIFEDEPVKGADKDNDLPSIKNIGEDSKMEAEEIGSRSELYRNPKGQEKDEIYDSNILIGHRFDIKSLIRVEQEFAMCDQRYRSIREFVSNAQIENNHDNDLLYLH